MSLIPTTLTLFVATAEAPSLQRTDTEQAYGVYYDSSRWWHHNHGWVLGPRSRIDGHDEALYLAIQSALFNAPSRFNLIFEIEDKRVADRLTENTFFRAKRRAMGEECEDHSENTHGRILQLVDIRTKHGDCFVKFLFSGKDCTAQNGFEAARKLAEQALIDRA